MPTASARIGVAATLALCLFSAVRATSVAPPKPPQAVASEAFQPALGQKGKDVMWLPTPDALARRLLTMAELSPRDTLVDLGSGDGKVVIMAARDFGAQARGVEYDARMVELSTVTAAEAGVADKTQFVQGDIFKTDFSDASVVALYLLPELNLKLRPQLMAMTPGTRIVSHYFDMGRWMPDQEAELAGRPGFLWIVPANAGGDWRVSYAQDGVPVTAALTLTQTFQKVAGSMAIAKVASGASASTGAGAGAGAGNRDRADSDIHSPQLKGRHFTFANIDHAGEMQTFDGEISGDTYAGTLTQSGGVAVPFRAQRVGQAPIIDGAGQPTQTEMNAAALALGAQ